MLGRVINQVVNGSSARRERKDGSVCIGSWPVSNDVGNVVGSCLDSLIESLNSSSEVCNIISIAATLGSMLGTGLRRVL